LKRKRDIEDIIRDVEMDEREVQKNKGKAHKV
jgi:hypothetical protein